MAMLAPRVRSCGCATLPGHRCSHMLAYRQETKARADKNRPTARQRGYNSKWDKARATFLAKHPRCAKCGKPARIVDHVIPHKGISKVFWDTANWQSLCTPCHSGIKQREERQ